MKTRYSLLITCLAFSLAGPVSGEEPNYADLVRRTESGGDYNAVSDISTATGGYQFMHGTLVDLGYIKPGSTPPAGEGSWENVEWTGKGGVHSRSEFRANQGVQDAALSEFTQRNWSAISSSANVGDTVNGVPMTQSGALHAAHMMGAGAFNTWAGCDFQPQCLSATQADANNMSIEQYQAHLMGRVAEGGGYDSSMIIDGEWGGGAALEVPMTGLMNWKAGTYSQIRPHGGN